MSPFLAGIGMAVQDTLDVMIAQAETRGHGWLAGFLDIFKWLATLIVIKIGLDNVFGKDHWTAAVTVVAVGLGTLIGRHTGTVVGDRYIHED